MELLLSNGPSHGEPPPPPPYLLSDVTWPTHARSHSFVHTFATIATPLNLMTTMGSGVWVLYIFSFPSHLFKMLILDKELYMLF